MYKLSGFGVLFYLFLRGQKLSVSLLGAESSAQEMQF